MKKIYLILILCAGHLALSQALDSDPFSSGILLSGSGEDCDSILLPEDNNILEESRLVRYMTGGMPQIVISREEDPAYLYFRIIPFSNSGNGIDYEPAEATACLELDNQLPAGEGPDLEPPVITGLYPPPGAKEVPVRTGLWLTADEPVRKDSGMIRLFAEDSLYAEINILSETAGISGDTVFISLPELARDRLYHVYMDSTCFSDLNDNHPVWNNSDSSWSFHTITGDLYFSEYVEGDGYLKGIELINPSTKTLSLDDYRIHYSRNGAGLTGLYYFPQGVLLPPGQVFAVMHQAIIDLDTFQLPPNCQADILTSTIVTFNGNDALGLEKSIDGGQSWYLVDLFGDPVSVIDFDVAGVAGAAKDHSLLRKDFIRFGNTDWEESSGTNLFGSEWKVYPVNYLANLGYPSPPCDSSAEISNYYFPGVTDSTRILNDSSLIYVYLKPDILADSLVPAISIPEYSTIIPPPGTPVPAIPGQLSYTVTAEDRVHSRVWTIIMQYPVPEEFNTIKELKSSTLPAQRILYSGPALVTAVKDNLVFIQDSTAGILVAGSSVQVEEIAIGSSLAELSGQVTLYEGITCINLLDEPVIITGGADSVSPVDLLVQDILQGGDRYESMLIRIRNARFFAPGTFFQAGQNYKLSQGSDTANVVIDFFNSGLQGTTVPGFASVTGILISSADALYVAPRFYSDLEVQVSNFDYDPSDVLLIVPNPGPGIFTISGHQLTGPARLKVFNLAGQKVYESEFADIESVDIIVNLENQPAGTYLLFMTVREHIYICLLVKTE